MDEQERDARVAGLFRDAAADPPPAGFDAGDVVAASRRITRRRRSALAGAALAVLAVAGVGVTAGLGGGSGSELATASAGAQNSGAGAAEDAAAPQAAAPEAASAPDAAPAGGSGGARSGSRTAGGADAAKPAPVATPLGPGTRECADRQDPALRALVEQVLPEVVGAPEAVTTQECRPGGERGVALEVDGGLLAVTSLPAGEMPQLAPEARSAPTASGGTVVVSSRAGRAGDPAPFADRLDAVAASLAPLL